MIRQKYIHNDIFEFEAGGCIEGLEVAYHCSEKPYQEGQKVIWICHALTANSDAQDWWPELVGPGRLFDTEKYFVVCANMLGSAYGSSGPATVNPATGKPYYFDFPRITVRDIVKANDLVREHLGIEKIDLMVGGSIGGFQSIEWSIMNPELFDKAVFIACGARVTPWLTAWEESQRLALEADPTFRACESLKGGEAGLRCARSIALISYRSYEGYNATQQEENPAKVSFERRAHTYQQYQGEKLRRRFNALSYYRLSEAVDSHNIARGRGSIGEALAKIKARTLVVAISSDILFPPEAHTPLREYIEGVEYHLIESSFGHDGFLVEHEKLNSIIENFIN